MLRNGWLSLEFGRKVDFVSTGQVAGSGGTWLFAVGGESAGFQGAVSLEGVHWPGEFIHAPSESFSVSEATPEGAWMGVGPSGCRLFILCF